MIPLQIGLPFPKGRAHSPVFANLDTQLAVRSRWPDGSVKHAVLCAMIAAGGKLDVVEGKPGVPLDQAPSVPQLGFSAQMDGVLYDPNTMPFVEHFAGAFCTQRSAISILKWNTGTSSAQPRC